MATNVSPARRALIMVAVVAGVTAVAFWPVVGFDFVRWDDEINILGNPLLTDPWSWDLVKRMFGASQALRFEPVHWLLLRAFHAVFGLDSAAWHTLGLALHVACAVLLALVLRQVFTLSARRQQARAPATAGAASAPSARAWSLEFAAAVGALVWSLHPVRAEVVAWATASTYPLAALGVLASFWCYLRGATTSSRRLLVLAWIFALVAYGSYPVAATYALWLLAVDRWLLRPARDAGEAVFPVDGWASLRRALWFGLPAVAAVAVTLVARLEAPGVFTAAPDLGSVGVPVRLVMALADLAWFPVQVLWPTHLTPDHAALTLNHATDAQLASFAVAGAITLWLAWRNRRHAPGLALIVFGAVAIAIPCLGLTERPVWPVDRYGYLVDMIIVGGLAGAGLTLVKARFSWLVAVPAAAIVGVCVVASRRQVRIWRDSTALFTALASEPSFENHPGEATHVYLLWGSDELAHGNWKRADALFARAKAIGFPAIQAAAEAGDYRRALALTADLGHVFALTPLMRRNQAEWLLRMGSTAAAIDELKQVQRAMPNDPETRRLLQQAEDAEHR
ncbi:MAG TPA: hypothetical protein VHE61_20910 [Opitutaceae bacterium]|nr:hypothetical protein [Opitutaceae bacterium]